MMEVWVHDRTAFDHQDVYHSVTDVSGMWVN